ncbi:MULTISPECIES: Ig-like domain-containing protein [Paenibacillus]|uniref:Ig-like domain-containing protein n=1 Tax=Paenibacillus TaxID=44249 RepID=UPI002FE2F363
MKKNKWLSAVLSIVLSASFVLTSAYAGTEAAYATAAIVNVDSVEITGDVEEVYVGESVQLTARVLPTDATNQGIHWMVLYRDGVANIDSETGILWGIYPGIVEVYALADENNVIRATKQIMVKGQTLPASMTISNQENTTQVTLGESLHFIADIQPTDAFNKKVTWSINGLPTPGTDDQGRPVTLPGGYGSFDENGVLTTTQTGRAEVMAISVGNPNVKDTMQIEIVPPQVDVSGITVSSLTDEVYTGGTLPMTATVAPSNATDKRVTWSVEPLDGQAVIHPVSGEVSGLTPGEVKIVATSVQNPAVSGSKTITVKAPPAIPVSSIAITSPDTVQVENTLQLNASVQPDSAHNRGVTWNVQNGTGSATVDAATGLLTATGVGKVTVTATAADGSGVFATQEITVTPILVNEIVVTSEGSATSVTAGNKLQFSAEVKPSNATNKNVIWTVANETGSAVISDAGLLTANAAGTVTVKATAADASQTIGTFDLTILAAAPGSNPDPSDGGSAGNGGSGGGTGGGSNGGSTGGSTGGSGSSTSGGSGGSSASAPAGNTKEIEVIVDMGQGQSEVSKAKIQRTTGTDGIVKDNVTLGREKAQEAVDKAIAANQPTVRVVIPDEEDEVGETKVNVPVAALNVVSSGGKNLGIYTENGSVLVPNGSLLNFPDDLYFRLVPVKQKSEQEVIRDRAVKETVVTTISKDLAPFVVSRPMTIETNMQSRPVTLVLPLRDVTMPASEQEKKAFLDSLAIYIEHSDGSKELVRGSVVDYGSGEQGLQFQVNKFSTFTILSWDGKDLTAHQAYIKGYPDGTFKPDRSVTRAEMAMMLARNLGYAGTASRAVYPDMADGYWANGAISFVKEKNLMIGDERGNFRPEAAVTRAEMAVTAARIKQLTPLGEAEASGAFNDIQGHWAAGYIAAGKASGVIAGYQDSSFAPSKELTRAETVTVVNRLFNRGPLYGVDIRFWSDVETAHWAYQNIMEASYSHDFEARAEGGEQVK